MRRRTDSTGEGSVPVRQRNPGDDLHGVPAPETAALRVVAGGAEKATRGSEAVARGDLSREAQFRQIYERHFDDVVGWLYALGAPSSDTEDIAQEIFIVVRRNLGRFDGGNLTGWLYRIAQLTVSDYRRRAWFRNLVLGRQDLDLSAMPHSEPGPVQQFEEAEARRQLQLLVGKMHRKLAATFILFEIEGHSGEDISRTQDIPIGTVWSRLHEARKEFWKLVKRRRQSDEGPGRQGKRSAGENTETKTSPTRHFTNSDC
jgi:RNA polymerase sigma-70 factor (ECF subfamily)